MFKRIIRLFIPPVIKYFIFIVAGFKGSLKIRGLSTVKYNSKSGKTIYILGNGPSFNNTLEQSLSILQKNECMVVNNFAVSPNFTLIKPTSYLVVDPAFSKRPEDLSDYLNNMVSNTMDHIINDVKWKMTMYLPGNARNGFFYNHIKDNSFIDVVFFNNSGISLIDFPSCYFYLLNRGKITPLSQTVLNTCISLAITMRYSNIFLVGADTSWHEDYWMDQSNNDLYMIDKHFYGTEKRRLFNDTLYQHPTRIHEELYADSLALKSYWILADYAKYNQVKVYNASAYSWIDAFERKKL